MFKKYLQRSSNFDWTKIEPSAQVLSSIFYRIAKQLLAKNTVLFRRAFLTSLIKIYEKSETQLKPCQTSEVEFFAEIVHGLRPLTIFTKKFHFRCLMVY